LTTKIKTSLPKCKLTFCQSHWSVTVGMFLHTIKKDKYLGNDLVQMCD